MPIPASGSGCQRVGESKQTQANSPPTGSNRRGKKKMNGLTCSDLPLTVDVREYMRVSRERRIHQQLEVNKRGKKKEGGLTWAELAPTVDVK